MMSMDKHTMDKHTIYNIYFPDEVDTLVLSGGEIYEALNNIDNVKKIKDIHASLTKAVEQGSEINLGIVIGQVLCMLNQIKDGNQINQGSSRII